MDKTNRLLEENERLKRAVEELSILNELAVAVGATYSSEEVTRRVISRSLRAVNAEQGVITLVDEHPDQSTKTLVRTMVSSSEHAGFRFNEALLGWMILNKSPLTLNDPRADERFHGAPWDESIHSVLCAPMMIRSILKGVLSVYNKKEKEGFTPDDQRLLVIIASQSAQVVEITRLYEELLARYREITDYKNNLEAKVEERTAELKMAQDKLSRTVGLLENAQQAQNRFFTNISHEFRTPLTLIMGPVKQIAETMANEKTREDLRIVYRNANRLLGLVNQLLDISKIESGGMKLQAAPLNIVLVLQDFVLAFSPYAEKKRITLRFNAAQEEIIAYIDREKLEKIVTNVLSNALMFTAERGVVELNLSREEGVVNICISDTGIGIAGEEIPKIFDRFYQVDGSHMREGDGTGLGLALTKDLVELHKGTVRVESEVGKGTVFTITFPLGRLHLDAEEICEPMAGGAVDRDLKEEEVSITRVMNQRVDGRIIIETEKPVVLIVEDNSDVRRYVRGILEKDYAVLEAIDGEDGWKKSTANIPDLIVTDVMMPKMDGFELCGRLKTDERTSHIPVIILTARASSEDKIEGFETGADEYLMKPFEAEELKAMIKNLIAQRKRLHDHFRRKGILELDELNITPVDEKFMRNVFTIIEKNISNSFFNVEHLAEMSAVSRSVLHKKVVSLTGEPPVELIRRIRLTRAAELIEKRSGNISEIALDVGFTNPAYFSECFKKQFGRSPSQYLHITDEP